MGVHATELVRKESLEELCAHRARAVELYQVTCDRLADAMKAHSRAAAMSGRASTPYLAPDRNGYWLSGGARDDEIARFMGEMTRRIDRDIWRGLIIGTPIGSLMDAQERKAFQDSLEKEPPPATVDNVRATLERLLGESDTIFRRGLVNAFKALDREYASNDGFKIGERIVLTWGVTWDKIMGYFTLHERRSAELQDVDRVMHVLDGKPAPDHQQGLGAALREHTYSRGRDKDTTGETAYWRYRLFKNGNIHLWPTRKDLLDRANRIIAEHFGMVVPASREARQAEPDYQPRPNQRLEEDFFPTPKAIGARAVALAQIAPGHRVLEPSAGTGALAEVIYQALGSQGDLVCYEVNDARAAQCGEWQFDVRQRDFLQVEPEPIYDRVVMNPPFSQQQDIRHVLHALRFLKQDGRLVAIMSPSWQWRFDKLSQRFRTTFDLLKGEVEKLPEGSFKASGTAVNACLVSFGARSSPLPADGARAGGGV